MRDHTEVCPVSRGVMSMHHIMPLNPCPLDYRAAFAFSAFLYPHRQRLSSYPDGFVVRRCPGWAGTTVRAYPVPTQVTRWVRSCLFTGGTTSACRLAEWRHLGHIPFGPSHQHLGLVRHYGVYRQFTYVDHTIKPSLPTALMLAVLAISSRSELSLSVGDVVPVAVAQARCHTRTDQ